MNIHVSTPIKYTLGTIAAGLALYWPVAMIIRDAKAECCKNKEVVAIANALPKLEDAEEISGIIKSLTPFKDHLKQDDHPHV